MKLAVAGKGGVGKTTISSLLAGAYSAAGRRVIAIDANPDTNFATALGISAEEASQITPIAKMNELIEERTGSKPGSAAPIFKLNPKVDDIPDQFSVKKGNISLLIMGDVKIGGGGCVCPESTLLKALLSHLLLARDDVVIMDMDAGLEHLARGTAKAVDAFIIVVEPGQRSIQTARAVQKLAGDLGIQQCYVVGSKVRGEQDRKYIEDNLPDFEILGFIDYDPQITDADRQGIGVFEHAPETVRQVEKIIAQLDKIHTTRKL